MATRKEAWARAGRGHEVQEKTTPFLLCSVRQVRKNVAVFFLVIEHHPIIFIRGAQPREGIKCKKGSSCADLLLYNFHEWVKNLLT